MNARITVFDGADCIGGNKIHLEFDGHGVLLDFGTNYKTMGRYYEEFLSPRQGRGLHDFVRMGIVPQISCYRPDLVPCDMDMSGFRELKVDALLVSHAHMDHIGNAGLLDLAIPFVASPMTAAIMKAIRDCGQRGMEGECVYSQARNRSEDDPRKICAKRMGKDDRYLGRDFVMTEAPSSDMREFWQTSVFSKGIDAGELLQPKDLDFQFRSFPVDHSIYGATAYAVETSSGWVAYTGDVRAHGASQASTWDFVDRASKLEPEVLIIEGTRTSRDDTGGEQSEQLVESNCLEAVEAERGMVIADFSPRNFERLDTFIRIAEATGRKLIVTKKDAYCLRALRSADGEDRMRRVSVYDALKLKESGAEEAACADMNVELVGPDELAKDVSSAILCFSMYDLGNLLDIRAEGGTYLYSSSEPYSEEQVIDFRRLSNWLELFDLKVRGFRMLGAGDPVPVMEKGFHASGHASTDDLMRIVERIAPKKVIPVHTEDPSPFEKLRDVELIVPEKGKAIEF